MLERPVVHHNISRFFDLKLAAVRAVRLHIINAGHVWRKASACPSVWPVVFTNVDSVA